MITARDAAETSLANAQKQADNQTRRLHDAEDQLKITKEQIVELKKKMAEVEGAKKVIEQAKEEALKAREEAELARTKAEASKKKAEETAFDLGVADTQALLKSQVPEVCRRYHSQTWNEALKQAGVKTSFDLWKVERVYYPSAILETAPSNSEAKMVLEEAGAAPDEIASAITTLDALDKEVEPTRVNETDEGLSKEVPQGATKSSAGSQAIKAKGVPLLVDSRPVAPLVGGLEDPKAFSTQPPKKESG
ncbi:uncharacterized protein LOC111999011 [Quercus suber]|uniref:uncharacterized protein LOC111999011 n=1 Tax=Quercus suber TaxID=58331 RepID=UPI000CE17483|nr:uncharacterized protein LOC111999011 [Quercus suber]